jgi:hypothetical protein
MMKNILLVLGVVLTLVGCDTHGEEYTYNKDRYDILTIEGCEYIKVTHGYNGYLALKGNQSNPKCGCGVVDTVFITNRIPIDSASVAVEYLKSKGH